MDKTKERDGRAWTTWVAVFAAAVLVGTAAGTIMVIAERDAAERACVAAGFLSCQHRTDITGQVG